MPSAFQLTILPARRPVNTLAHLGRSDAHLSASGRRGPRFKAVRALLCLLSLSATGHGGRAANDRETAGPVFEPCGHGMGPDHVGVVTGHTRSCTCRHTLALLLAYTQGTHALAHAGTLLHSFLLAYTQGTYAVAHASVTCAVAVSACMLACPTNSNAPMHGFSWGGPTYSVSRHSVRLLGRLVKAYVANTFVAVDL